MAALVTNVGITKIIAALFGDSHTAPTYIHWGTGSTTEAVGNTALQTASAEARTNGTKSKVTTNTTDDTYQVVGSIVSAGTQTIAEAGLFDASTAGNMYVRGTFTGIALAASDAIEFTIKIVLDQA
jgi:hypothetical protein